MTESLTARHSLARGRVVVAALLAVAGGLHIAALPSHAQESSPAAAFFLAAGLGQLITAVLLVARPSRATTATVVVGNVAILGVWTMSRLVGVPLGAHQGQPEPVAALDGLATALELVVIAGAVHLARRTGHRGVPRSASWGLVGTMAGVWLIAGGLGTALADPHPHVAHDHQPHVPVAHDHQLTRTGAHGDLDPDHPPTVAETWVAGHRRHPDV
ncbi:MAG: hypothetical protein ACRD0C_05520 [Acidimicrobiia bacterium]